MQRTILATKTYSEVSTSPADEPVEAADFRAFGLNVFDSTQETNLDALVETVRTYIEHTYGIGLVTQTITDHFDDFEKWSLHIPCPNLRLYRYPVNAINSIKYYDSDNILQTLAASNYNLLPYDTHGEIEYTSDFSKPSLYDRPFPVQIEYTVGWSQANVPAPIKQQIITAVARMYYDKLDMKKALSNLSIAQPYLRKVNF